MVQLPSYNLMVMNLTPVPISFPLSTLPMPGDTTAPPLLYEILGLCATALCCGLLQVTCVTPFPFSVYLQLLLEPVFESGKLSEGLKGST